MSTTESGLAYENSWMCFGKRPESESDSTPKCESSYPCFAFSNIFNALHGLILTWTSGGA
jgi:hypothetical protein